MERQKTQNSLHNTKEVEWALPNLKATVWKTVYIGKIIDTWVNEREKRTQKKKNDM